MRKVWVILNIIAVALLIAGACLVNSFGMVLISAGLTIGIVSGFIWKIYFTKRGIDEINDNQL